MYTLEGFKDKSLYIIITIVYFVFWVVKYMDLSGYAYAISMVALILQLKSFKWATYIYLLIIFIPFLSSDFLGTGILRLNRLAFIPFILYGIKENKINKFHFNKLLFALLLASFILIRASSDYQKLIQLEEWSIYNSLASWFDLFSYLIFFYIVFTRFTLKDTQLIFNFIIFLALLEGLTLVFLIYKNPDFLYDYGKDNVLWNSPYFEHKNFWGVFYAFISLTTLSFIISKRRDVPQSIIIVIFIISLSLMLLSLSRRAIIIFIIGVIYLSIAKKQYKILISGFFLFALVVLLDFDFISNRYGSIFNARSITELQAASSGQLRERAYQQFFEYFDFVPQMFERKWEYNWSEGFWTGLLYQLGVFGMIFNIIVLLLIYRRYSLYSFSPNNMIRNNSILIMMFCLIFFLGAFTLRSMYFIDYYGNLKQTGILVLFLMYQNEFLISRTKGNLNISQ